MSSKEAYSNDLAPGEKISITEESFNQAQTPVKYNFPVSVNLRKQLSVKLSKDENRLISSCIKIGNKLVFVDHGNDRLTICSTDGTEIRHIPMPYNPKYIIEINNNTVAVSCDSTILMINISTGNVTRTIIANGYCHGISYNGVYLYVVIDESIIRVMDLAGKVKRTIALPLFDIRDIIVDRDRLVCTYKLAIHCCSLDGKLIWEFKKKKFKDLRCVTTDDDGTVYVTDYKTNIVVVVSYDGKKYKEIITDSNGVNKPRGNYFDKNENILLVCNEGDGKVFLFDVIKK